MPKRARPQFTVTTLSKGALEVPGEGIDVGRPIGQRIRTSDPRVVTRDLKLVTCILAGGAAGKFVFSLRLRRPGGGWEEIARPTPLEFDTANQNIFSVQDVPPVFTEYGLHWLDFLIDGEVAARIPIEIAPLSGASGH